MQIGDGQHNCSTEHGHHSKEPIQLFKKLSFVGKTFDLSLCIGATHFG
jgi:hypothetical protein